MTTIEEVNALVRLAFEQAQGALVTLEEAARQEDRSALHELSQAYARILSPLRDYVVGANMGRALPKQLAKRVSEPADAIFDHVDEVAKLGLKPDAESLTALIRAAESAA